jgi:non-specific serine/threonine protein kinase/serine/threonine-protein kinase
MTGTDGDTSRGNPEAGATQLDSRSPSNSVPALTLDSSATPSISNSAAAVARAREPKSIGPYQLIRKIGEGGMGQVWLAEQTAPVHRKVALKLIKVGMYDDDLLRRFQAERQSLAMMDHPSIAKVFDAGTTPDGQPYFVMEYVSGVPITQYCDEKRLTIKQRLELFIKVCEGVQHAHQKAIIHRDLKPANILVTEVDGKPVPRIIDFGLAKATTPEMGSETMFTRVGAFVGTPGYMSPEQAETTVQDVDTRTDVYSLGAVLYVLLSGDEPFDSSQWNRTPLYEVLRQLREVEPPTPSAKVRMDNAASTSKAGLRSVQPKQLAATLHGDLDWITMKALEKDRARRYGAPSELAADIGRYLNLEPVVARPASTGYRLQKYLRRHRAGVAVVAGLVLLVAAFVAMQGVQLRRTTRERDRANRVTDFMTGMFKVSDPSEARGNSITAREVLDKASKEIDTGLAKDPETQAQMKQVMGQVYTGLGLYPSAESLLTSVVEIRRRLLGPEHADTLSSASYLGWVIMKEGRYAEAEKSFRETLDISRRVLGPEHPDTLQLRNRLAGVLHREGRYAEAEKLDRETLEIRRRVLGPEHPDTLISMGNLANDLTKEGRLAEAEKLQRESFDIRRRVFGPDHPATLNAMSSLADSLTKEGRLAEAEKLVRENFDIDSRVFGPDHSETAIVVYNLGCIAARKGNSTEALSLLRQAVDHGLEPFIAGSMEKDPDLNSLHGDPRFTALVAHAKEVAQSKKADAPKQN